MVTIVPPREEPFAFCSFNGPTVLPEESLSTSPWAVAKRSLESFHSTLTDHLSVCRFMKLFDFTILYLFIFLYIYTTIAEKGRKKTSSHEKNDNLLLKFWYTCIPIFTSSYWPEPTDSSNAYRIGNIENKLKNGKIVFLRFALTFSGSSLQLVNIHQKISITISIICFKQL